MTQFSARLRALWVRVRPHTLPIALYTVLTVAITWPTVLNLSTHIYGFKGDHRIWMWMAWWRKYSLLHHLPYRFVPLAQAPFGTDQAFRAYPGLLWVFTGLSIPFGETAAFNLLRLGAYVASGTLTYALAFKLTKKRLVSFIAGLVFAFSPYAIEHGMWHVNVAQQWVLPLFVLALLNLREKQTVPAAMWLSAAFAVGFYTENYYSYHTIVMALVFAIVELIVEIRQSGWHAALNGRRYGLYAVAGVLGAVLVTPELVPVLRELSAPSTSPLRSQNTLLRPDIWHFELASRPWDFLLPPETNPILGKLSAKAYAAIENIHHLDFAPPFLEDRYGLGAFWFWTRSKDASSNELYLGLANLTVAGAAIAAWWRSRKAQNTDRQPTAQNFWMAFLIALFVVALLFSLPPFLPIGALFHNLWEPLGNIVIPMPSYLTMKFVQPLRINRRFAAPMLLALAILVAYGLDVLLARTRKPLARTALLSVFLAVLVVEYARPSHMESIAPTADVVWLTEHADADDIVMTYPFPDADHVLEQTFHELPIVDSITIDANFVMDNIQQVEKMAIADLTAPGTVEKLAALGVRYVVNRHDAPPAPQDGLELVFSSDTADVYEVTAEPAKLAVLATLQDGLWVSEADWSWQERSSTFTVWNPLESPVEVEITMPTGSEDDLPPLLASRVMTPHPQQIIWSGILMDNPHIPPEYSSQPVEAINTGRMETLSMRFYYGETTVRLDWASTLPDGTYPAVMSIELGDPQIVPDGQELVGVSQNGTQ